MANTTPIVVTVTRTTTKEKVLNEAETAPRINILDFYEEHYTDILLVMNRIRHDKQREVHTRLDFGENSRKSRRIREGQIPGIVLMVEATLTGGTLLIEIVLGVETAPAASKNHMITSTLPTGRTPNMDIAPTTETAPVERWAMPTWCHMFNSTLIGAARIWFDDLPLERIDGYKDLKAAFLAYFMQQKKYVKDPVEIYNIKQRDGEPSRTSWNGSSQGKEGGLADLPPSRTPKEILAAPGRKVPSATTYGMAIGGTLSVKGRTELCSLLKENLDIFAWQPSDMTGVPRSVAEHRLNIQEGYSPIRQNKRGHASKHEKAIQAELAESDEEKMAFHTDQGVYCYTKLPIDLKNAGATYQRLVDKAFDRKIGQNVEVYVDDLVIKSHTEVEMLRDISETFCTLRKINMKFNPKKCAFRAVEGLFLGYMISPEEIKPCPDKTKAVLQFSSPRTIKEVQSLNGKLASLNRFLSKSAKKSLPPFKTLKKCIKKSNFHWTSKAEQAFKQLKQHLSKLPLLVAPKPKEEPIVYMSTSYGSISAVLMTERGTVQTSVYFVIYAL
nr:reverse transcriptase domain-containing protein [Tanacetum cinerariifolium]